MQERQRQRMRRHAYNSLARGEYIHPSHLLD